MLDASCNEVGVSRVNASCLAHNAAPVCYSYAKHAEPSKQGVSCCHGVATAMAEGGGRQVSARQNRDLLYNNTAMRTLGSGLEIEIKITKIRPRSS